MVNDIFLPQPGLDFSRRSRSDNSEGDGGKEAVHICPSVNLNPGNLSYKSVFSF